MVWNCVAAIIAGAFVSAVGGMMIAAGDAGVWIGSGLGFVGGVMILVGVIALGVAWGIREDRRA